MATDGDDATAGLATDAPGLEEGSTFAWPMLLRRRVVDRMEASEHYPWLVLAVVLFGLFAVGSTITILAIAVPTIAEDLGTDVNTVSWVTTGPILAFAVFGPLGGKLADLRGLRKAYLFSLAGAMVFAGLTALSPTATALIAFRVCGAAIGAATGPASLAIINRTFPPSRRSQALGYWAMVAAGGPVIGALIGAPVIEAYGWRWIFIAQVPRHGRSAWWSPTRCCRTCPPRPSWAAARPASTSGVPPPSGSAACRSCWPSTAAP